LRPLGFRRDGRPIWPIAGATNTFGITARAYRWYADGTETGAAALAAENASHGLVVSGNTAIVLRYGVQESGAGSASGLTTDDYQLQHNLNGAGFVDTTAGSTVVQGFTSADLTDADPTTQRLSAGTGSFIAGEISETDGLLTDWQLTANNFSELLYAIQVIDADTAVGDSITFRVLRNAGVFNTYSVTPTLTVVLNAIATPSTVAAVAATPAPTLAAAAIATPASTAAVAAVPAPTVIAESSVVVSPSTVAAVAAVPGPTVIPETRVTPGTVAGVAAVPAPVIAAGAIATPSTVAVIGAVPAPTVTAGATASPTTATVIAAVPAPSILAGAIATPATAAVFAAIPVPTIIAGSGGGDAIATPTTVAGIAAVPAPTIWVAGPLGPPVRGPTRASPAPPNDVGLVGANRVEV
jgi:hypothetical protein